MEKSLAEKLEREKIVKNEPAIWVDSASVMQNGRLILTRKHIVFVLNDAPKPAITIDIDTINSLAHEDVLTDHNILSVTYMQYNKAMFSVLNYHDWEKNLEEQRMKPHIKMKRDNGNPLNAISDDL